LYLVYKNSQKFTEIHRKSKKIKENQRNSKKFKEIQRNSKKFKEIQRNFTQKHQHTNKMIKPLYWSEPNHLGKAFN
jgi:3-methyladenine DNA glycosylase Tag